MNLFKTWYGQLNKNLLYGYGSKPISIYEVGQITNEMYNILFSSDFLNAS